MDIRIASVGEAAKSTSTTGQVITNAIAIFFTGPFLAIVAIVACGKWLGMLFALPQPRDDSFGPAIPGFLRFSAKGHEPLLGLTAFILALAIFGLTVRGRIGPFVKNDFGLNIGQFVSLCFVSSISILALAAATFLAKQAISLPLFHRNSLAAEQQRRIRALPVDRGGGGP
jgi:hypothetical protein